MTNASLIEIPLPSDIEHYRRQLVALANQPFSGLNILRQNDPLIFTVEYTLRRSEYPLAELRLVSGPSRLVIDFGNPVNPWYYLFLLLPVLTLLGATVWSGKYNDMLFAGVAFLVIFTLYQLSRRFRQRRMIAWLKRSLKLY